MVQSILAQEASVKGERSTKVWMAKEGFFKEVKFDLRILRQSDWKGKEDTQWAKAEKLSVSGAVRRPLVCIMVPGAGGGLGYEDTGWPLLNCVSFAGFQHVP